MVYLMNEKCLSVLTAPWNTIESSALFNPSIVEDDQSDLEIGEKRIIISFRAPLGGIFHPLFFRRAILDKNNDPRNENWKKISKKQRFARRYLIKNVLLLNWQK
jgi:hypothetical protein